MTTADRTRFAHLIYTSFDDGSGTGGGWQVKDVSGGLDAGERDALTAWVSTRFDLQPALDRYPTPEAIEGRQRRLVYATTSAGAAYWHTAEAGTDGSGRPGNVFAHVVLDRAVGESVPVFRPIELWRSPTWLMPYGPVATRASTVSSADLPSPGDVVSRDQVLSFLTDVSVFRLGLFQVLLDSVAHAWNGGPSVVLLVDDSTSAALWIGAVSYFMSAGTSRRFSWSTHDRADAMNENKRRGIHLTIVPTSERDLLAEVGGIVVLDESDDPTLGMLDADPHQTHAGVSVEVTPWSMMAQMVLLDQETAQTVLQRQDSIADEAGDLELSPMWPLAMAVVSMPGMEDVRKEASRVVSEERPPRLHPDSRLAQESDQVDAASAPRTAFEAKSTLIRTQSHSRGVTVALSNYVRLAIRDHEWLSQHRAAEVDAQFDGSAPAAFSTDIRDFVDELGRLAADQLTKPADLAVRIVRVSDVLITSNSHEAVNFDLAESLCRAFEPIAGVLLNPVAGPRVIAEIGAIDERTMHVVVRQTLVALPQMQMLPFGRRFDERVLRWLFRLEPTIPYLSQIADQTEIRHDIVLYSEYVFGALLSDWARPDERARMQELADLAIWGILDDQRNREDPAGRIDEVRTLCRLGSLSLADVGELFRSFGSTVPAEAARHAVLYEKSSGALPYVLAELTARGHRLNLDSGTRTDADRSTLAWCALRGLAAWNDLERDDVEKLVASHFDLILHDFERLSSDVKELKSIAPDLLRKLAVLFYVAQSIGRDVSMYSMATRSHLMSAAESQPDVLRGLIERGIVDIARIAGRSFIDFVKQRARQSAPVMTREGEFVSELVRQQLYSGPSDAMSLRDAMWPLVREMSAGDAEYIFGVYSDLAGEWLEVRGIRSPASPDRPGRESGLPW